MEKRDEAARGLDKIGEPAVPLLREATKSADPEVCERAKKLLGVGLKDPQPVAEPDRAPRLVPAPAPPADKRDR